MSTSTDNSDVEALNATIQHLVTQLLTSSYFVTATNTIKNTTEAASTSQLTQMLAIGASTSTAADAAKVTDDADKATYFKSAAPVKMSLHPGSHGAKNIINYGLTIGANLYNASVTPFLKTRWEYSLINTL